MFICLCCAMTFILANKPLSALMMISLSVALVLTWPDFGTFVVWHLAVDRTSRRHLFAVSSQRQWCTHGLIQLSMSMPLRTFILILLHAWHTGILVLLAFSVVDTCHFSGSLQGLGSVVNGQDPALYCTSVKTDASLCVAFPVHGLFDHLVHWYYLSCAGLQTGRSQARHWHEDMCMAAASSRTSIQTSTWHSLFCQRQIPMEASHGCNTCAVSIPLA